MNMLKKNGGFTLVELIVVIAILAILAAVAVPAYNGYIAKANDAAVLTELTALHTAAQAACSMDGVELKSISISAEGEITVDPEADKTAYTAFYETEASTLAEMLAKHSQYNVGCYWTSKDGWKEGELPSGG